MTGVGIGFAMDVNEELVVYSRADSEVPSGTHPETCSGRLDSVLDSDMGSDIFLKSNIGVLMCV